MSSLAASFCSKYLGRERERVRVRARARVRFRARVRVRARARVRVRVRVRAHLARPAVVSQAVPQLVAHLGHG